MAGKPIGAKNASFVPLYASKRFFHQDIIGTDIGKVEKKRFLRISFFAGRTDCQGSFVMRYSVREKRHLLSSICLDDDYEEIWSRFAKTSSGQTRGVLLVEKRHVFSAG